MDFEQLKTFVSLANSKNFTRTAEEMNVVQSTVTARIKLLEEEVGETLFIRKTRNVEITDAGKTFLTYANQTLEIMNEGIETTRIKSNFNNNLVIGGMNSLWDTPIFGQINDYQSCNPKTAIRLITGHSDDIIEKIQYGLIDVGFVYNPPHSSLFNIYTIREEPIFLVGSPELVRKLGSVKSEAIKDIPFIHYNWGTEFSEWFEAVLGKHETMRYRVDHAGVAVRLILNGEGIGFMLESIIEKYERENLISQIPFYPRTSIPKRKVFMVSSKSGQGMVDAFSQYMIAKNKDY
ncbi:LysR family transcriptional regulator, repressor for citA [Salinibacillus kushneri]|uniref:LysR family transcriptional regulator, repressor for citA n=1 Tax=Salinibacillus kushneri TaxID=237682 RepID=A0A1I0DZU7_9BACI|nr:LysR family transcriptional regulator [Salinibacillus kushneri]SET37574.1 LysR family transcriptional regulator, repressor for citA [Salinibacillus kushneri]